MSRPARSDTYVAFLQYAFLALLAARGLTELLSSYVFYLGPVSVNVSVVAMVLMDAVGIACLAALWLRGEWLLDRIGTYLLIWVLALAPWVFFAAQRFGVPGLTGAREWIRLLSLVLVFFVVYAIARKRGPERIVNACLLALPAPLVFAYVELIRNLSSGASGPASRVMGSMVHPNILAAFLVVMIALAAWKLTRSIRNRLPLRHRAFWILTILAQVPPLILTVSSNGWGMLGIVAILLVAVIPGRRAKILAGIVIAGLVGIVLWFAASQPQLISEMLQNLNAVGLQTGEAEVGGSLQQRFEIWRHLVTEWRRQPLLGFGLSTARFLNPQTGLAAHNDYVRYLVETGAVGLSLFVGFLLLVGVRLVRMLKQARSTPHFLLVGVALAVFVAWILGGIGDNVISYTAFQVYLWALLAAASAAASDPLASRTAPAAPTAPGRRQAVAEEDWGSPGRRRVRERSDVEDPGSRLRSPARSDDGVGGSRRKLLSLAVLFAIACALIAGIGFYLWNRGLTAEAYFLGWMLAYGTIAFVLREERRRYIGTLVATALVALISVQAYFALPEFALRSASSVSVMILGGWIVWGAVVACVKQARRSQRPAWYAVPWCLVPLALLLTAGTLVPQDLLPDQFTLFAWTIDGDAVLHARETFIENRGLTLLYAFVGFVLAIGALGFATMRASRRTSSSASARWPRRLMKNFGQELRTISSGLLSSLQRFVRRTLLPLASLAAVSFGLRRLLASSAAFIDGDPLALATFLGWLSLVLAFVAVLTWGVSSEGLRRVSRRLVHSYVVVLGLIHLGSLAAVAGLWTVSKLLPAISAVERFAPLHRQRTPGLYTWIAAALSVAFGLLFLVFRRRAVRSPRPES